MNGQRSMVVKSMAAARKPVFYDNILLLTKTTLFITAAGEKGEPGGRKFSVFSLNLLLLFWQTSPRSSIPAVHMCAAMPIGMTCILIAIRVNAILDSNYDI